MRWRLPPTAPARPAPDPSPDPPGPGPVVLVLPAHDEAATVAAVVRRAPADAAGRPVRVVVVDDGSRDATAAEAAAAGARVVRHAHRRGLGAAIRTGLATAVAEGAAVVAFCDADGEYAPEELAALVAPVLDGRADYVVGSRFTGRIHRMLRRRRLGNRVLTMLLRWVSRIPTTDGQSGYRALSRDAARAATIEHDFNYAQVLTLDLVAHGFRYAEVPISYRFRESGRSFIRLLPYLCAVLPAMWRVVQRAPRPPAAEPATAVGGAFRRWVGVGIAAVAVAFAGTTLARAWPDARAAWADAQPLGLVAGLALAGLGMVLLASPWQAVARAVGAPPLTGGHWLRAYFTGELGKYVPGGIWPVVGRAEQARRAGVPAAAAYASVPLSLGYAYLAAGMVLAIAVVPAAAAGGRVGSVAWTLLVVPVGLLAVHPAVLDRALRVAERVLHRPLGLTAPPWNRSLALTARYVPAWCCIGAATVVIARSLAIDAEPVSVFAAAIASWLVGFLFLPAPGGLGVREATFAAVAPVGFALGIAIATTARLAFVVVDVVAFGIVVSRRRRAACAAGAACAASVLDDVGAKAVTGRGPRAAVERAIGA